MNGNIIMKNNSVPILYNILNGYGYKLTSKEDLYNALISELNEDKLDILKHITFTFCTKDINIKSYYSPIYKIDNKYYANLSIHELINLIETVSEPLRIELVKVKNEFPQILFDDLDKKEFIKYVNSNSKFTKNNNPISVDDYQVSKNISKNKNTFGDVVYDLCNITVKIILPYYIIDSMKYMTGIKSIFYKPYPIEEANILGCAMLENASREIQRYTADLMEAATALYVRTLNSDINFLPMNTIYETYITCSIHTLKNICDLRYMESQITSKGLTTLYNKIESKDNELSVLLYDYFNNKGDFNNV